MEKNSPTNHRKWLLIVCDLQVCLVRVRAAIPVQRVCEEENTTNTTAFLWKAKQV